MATLTTVSATTSATSAVAVNSGRKGVIFTNDDANRCYVLIGPGTVSSTNYSFSLAQNENACVEGCRDKASVIWGTAGSGKLYVTEYE